LKRKDEMFLKYELRTSPGFARFCEFDNNYDEGQNIKRIFMLKLFVTPSLVAGVGTTAFTCSKA
jgi:hypothetical protein